MLGSDFKNLSSSDLRRYIEQHNESDYILIDVRQPNEYTDRHIPGASLLPLSDLESHLFQLPSNKDLVFYCRSGGRSKVAATLAVDAEVSEKNTYQLEGGMLSWDGKMLPDFPKIRVFDSKMSVSSLLMTAMNLEKGAWRFYNHAMTLFSDFPFIKTIERLSKAESAHAKALYGFWIKTETNPIAFDTLFENLEGNLTETGESFSKEVSRIESIQGNTCLNFLEFALNIEYTAFDLYRSMADRTTDHEAQKAFLAIAQAEKSHMRAIAGAIPECK